MREYRIATLRLCGLYLAASTACGSDAIEFKNVEPERSETELAGARSHGPPSEPETSATGATGAQGSADAGSLPPDVSVTAAGTLLCGSALCQCNNGIDDDNDGTADGFDVECTGALDDDEGSFATGIPGDNRDPKWQDCFFDGNSGAGDDQCRYPTECLTGELGADAPACAVTRSCRSSCVPLTPNGCDCFGCCSFELPNGSAVDVLLNDACSLERIGDPAACPPCTKSTSCENECGECELCPGRTAADLPVTCTPEGEPPPPPDAPEEPPPPPPEPTPSCDGGTSCASGADCGPGQFCSLGCCLQIVLR